jgi:ABC-type tungstate transport system permease subunit
MSERVKKCKSEAVKLSDHCCYQTYVPHSSVSAVMDENDNMINRFNGQQVAPQVAS